MTIEVRPLGVACNLRCTYCYQGPMRATRHKTQRYDLGAIKAGVGAEGGSFTLFGGEPLLLPKRDLEELWSWGFVCWGRNSVQTNGVLVDSDHIRMFTKYNVSVGISIDGPDELNDGRRSRTGCGTRVSTAKTEATIDRLCKQHEPPSLIVTLHRLNATGVRLRRLQQWLRRLDEVGVASVRLHLLETDDDWTRKHLSLSTDENVSALLRLADLESSLKAMRFDLFADIKKQLVGQDQSTTCIWNACDPLTTRAVRGIEGSGGKSNCGRTNKEGIEFVKAERESFERYIALYLTPHKYGGCSGCRFFLMCRGNCPGTGIDGDWRNRSEHCGVWMKLFEHFEKTLVVEGRTPLSLQTKRLRAAEELICRGWASGTQIYVHQALRRTQ